MTQTTKLDLGGFTGSSNFFKHPLAPGYHFTDGVQYVAEAAGAYWLIDLIFSHQLNAKVRREELQVWKLTVSGHTAVARCTDGNDVEVVRQDIPMTDFPAEGVTMWLENKMLFLPSER